MPPVGLYTLAYHAKRISDRAPVDIMVARRGMPTSEERPVARHVARDKLFAQLLQRALELWGFAQRAADDHMEFYSLAIPIAACIVRDWRCWEHVGQRSAPLVAAARAVSVQHSREARSLSEAHPDVAGWIEVGGEGVPRLASMIFAGDVLADLSVASRAGGAAQCVHARMGSSWVPRGHRVHAVRD